MADQVTQSIIVNVGVADAYAIWSDFERFPLFMQHITSVTKTGDKQSHWVMEGPLGTKTEWDAETTRLETNKRIAWNSRDGGDIKTSGQVTFNSLPNNQTEVTVSLQYVPPAGSLGQAFANLFVDPGSKLNEDLRRFKEYAEASVSVGSSARERGR